MAARLQSDIKRSALGQRPGFLQRDDFCVGLARGPRGAPSDGAAISDDNGAHGRVGAGSSQRSLGQLDGLGHIIHAAACQAALPVVPGAVNSWEKRLAVGSVCPWYLLPKPSEP